MVQALVLHRGAAPMPLTLVDYDASHLEPLIALWREAFESGVGIADPHPLSEQREYFLSQVLPAFRQPSRSQR